MSWAEVKAVPWKNGGGTTGRLAVAPAGAGFADLDWSVSVAGIAGDGPFSDFAGLDRVLMLVAGSELILDVQGMPHRLDLFGTLAFPGEAAAACRVPSGPVRALNLMTRQGRATGAMRAVEVAGGHSVTVGRLETVVLVALTAGLVLDGHGALAALDAVVEDASNAAGVPEASSAVGRLSVTGSGIFAELRIGKL